MTRPSFFPIAVLIACVLAVPALARAQSQSEETPPAHVSYTEGRVILEYDANAEEIEANTPLVPGDRVRTEAGRAEIVFGDGSVLHLDEHTSLDLLSDRLVRLLAGRLAVIVGTGLAGQLQVDGASGSVRPLSAGEYRISLLPQGGGADLELAVVRGNAELFNDSDLTSLRAGQRALADVRGTLAGPWPFNSASFDAFERWSLARLDARRGHASYSYIPNEVRHYAGDFDRHGYWGHEPSYGYVWYPRVSYGWRPYYQGRWKHYPRWGWVWVGGPRWAWPTHHYGRWGVSSGGAWFWIPGRRWSGAWVHWGVAANYVSWCPLGFDNRPVFGFWTHGHRNHHSPWRGWTVIHRSHFGARRHVHALALDGQRVVATQRATFVTQGAAPAFRGGARAAGRDNGSIGVAVPRAGSAGLARISPAERQRSGRTAAARQGTGPSGVRSGTGARAGSGAGYAVRRGETPANANAPGSQPSTEAFRRRPGIVRSGEAAPSSGEADLTPFRRRSGRAVERTTAVPSPWHAEDIPVYRGTAPAVDAAPVRSGRTVAVPRSAPASADTGASADPGGAPEATPSRGTRGRAGYAVPRSSGDTSGYSSPRSSGASGRSYGAPSGRGSDAGGSAPSGDGGRVRRAPAGSGGGASSGTAVRRGSSGGGESSGGRAAGRRR